MNQENRAVLACRYHAITDVPVRDILAMYRIFTHYYENAPLDTFLQDMSNKTGVFLVRRRCDGRIVGFSTVRAFDMEVGGRKSRAIFSGDTLIEREYWGDRSLQRAFFLYVLRERFANPLRPLYWCLISKGFKTYLLLANNFPRYYPNPEGNWPELGDIVRDYCGQLFPGYLDEQRMLLDFGEGYMFLKEDAAPITLAMRHRYPKVRFFEARNPTWERGTELPCVGMLGWRDFAAFARTGLRKVMGRNNAALPKADLT